MTWRQVALIGALVAVVIMAALGGLYLYITTGGLIARQIPSSMEAAAAEWVLNLSVPLAARNRENPLGITDATVTAGRDLYQKKCEVCHGYDGSGKTEAGSGEFPPPTDLRGLRVTNRTDGELFYFIQNGIRNTAMPGWPLPDHSIWQLVAFVRSLPIVAPAARVASLGDASIPVLSAEHVGSAACKTCHSEIYDRWSKSLMANVLVDVKEHPEAILGDFSTPNDLVAFTREDVVFTYGSKWKQRYLTRIDDDYFVFPVQWDVQNKLWRRYYVEPGTDWWAEHYPADQMQRPTGPTCDGCHSTNYDIATKQVTEWNVGCEKCHGPGSEHVKNPLSFNVANPARLGYVEANDVCIQCHSQGQPLVKPIEGKYYDWPVGFEVGLKLRDFWKLEEPELGETTFTHFADGTARKNRMQGNDYVTSSMYTHGVTCFTCHDAHGTANDALMRKPADSLCLDCHGSDSPNGPFAATIQQHTHHEAGSAGNECIACHMPEIARTIGDVNVRSHTFRFLSPSTSEAYGVPNPCISCHTDKSNEWATEELRTWESVSPWRVAP